MADPSNRAILYPTAPMLQRARDLRKRQTPEEAKLWAVLRSRGLDGYKFKRQVPIGHFVVDFFCEEANLAIELDGVSTRHRKVMIWRGQPSFSAMVFE